jgi:hypothetical protein
LNKIYRQDDENFIDLLNKVRNNALDEDAYNLLQKHFNPEFQPKKDEGYITLTTHNARADAINAEALSSLPTASYFFKAVVETEFSEKMFPVDEVLELKLGSQVMFTKNDLDKSKRYFNGKIGTITEMSNDSIVVKCKDDAESIKVEKYKWENIRYTLNPQKQQVEEEVIGTFTQYPLRLAWAITIHKSQGLTFDKAIIDAGKAFAPGQVYVALSRCRTLDGIVLVSKIGSNSLFDDEHIRNFSKNYKSNHLNESLAFEKHLHQNDILQNIFNYDDELKGFDRLHHFIAQHKSSFNTATFEFAGSLKDNIVKLSRFGLSFNKELTTLNDNKILPEKNDALQERFKKAAAYFSKELKVLVEMINGSPAITDNKDNAKNYGELLKQIFIQVATKQVVLSALKNGFLFEQYQKAKKEFALPSFMANAYSSKSSGGYKHTTQPDLYDALKDLRDEICGESGDPIYMIANSKSLEEMATYLPQSKKELMQISGFGKAKVEGFGVQFLNIIVNYCQQNNLSSLIHTKDNLKEEKPKVEKPKTDKQDSKEVTFNFFKQGNTIKEIATERLLAISTIEGHLTWYIAEGKIAITELMTIEKATIIIKALEGFEKGSSVIPIKEQLGDNFSYSEIRMVMTHLDFVNRKV